MISYIPYFIGYGNFVSIRSDQHCHSPLLQHLVSLLITATKAVSAGLRCRHTKSRPRWCLTVASTVTAALTSPPPRQFPLQAPQRPRSANRLLYSNGTPLTNNYHCVISLSVSREGKCRTLSASKAWNMPCAISSLLTWAVVGSVVKTYVGSSKACPKLERSESRQAWSWS